MKWAVQQKNKESIDEPTQFGYNYPEEIVDEYCFYVISSGYHIFPRAGGLEDQDPLFMADLRTYRWLQEWAEQEVRGGAEGFAEEGQAKTKARAFSFDEL